jgi:hypothetical protein
MPGLQDYVTTVASKISGEQGISNQARKRVHNPMKPKSTFMSVRVRLEEQSFEIGCGPGNQQVKWLAMVAVQRYSGDYAKSLRGKPVLPGEVRNLRGLVVDPLLRIREAFKDGQECVVSFSADPNERWEPSMAVERGSVDANAIAQSHAVFEVDRYQVECTLQIQGFAVEAFTPAVTKCFEAAVGQSVNCANTEAHITGISNSLNVRDLEIVARVALEKASAEEGRLMKAVGKCRTLAETVAVEHELRKAKKNANQAHEELDRIERGLAFSWTWTSAQNAQNFAEGDEPPASLDVQVRITGIGGRIDLDTDTAASIKRNLEPINAIKGTAARAIGKRLDAMLKAKNIERPHHVQILKTMRIKQQAMCGGLSVPDSNPFMRRGFCKNFRVPQVASYVREKSLLAYDGRSLIDHVEALPEVLAIKGAGTGSYEYNGAVAKQNARTCAEDPADIHLYLQGHQPDVIKHRYNKVIAMKQKLVDGVADAFREMALSTNMDLYGNELTGLPEEQQRLRVEAQLEKEWAYIKITNLGMHSFNDPDAVKLKKEFCHYLPQLSRLFMHYCSVDARHSTTSISYVAFLAFVRNCGMTDGVDQQLEPLLPGIFNMSNDADDEHGAMEDRGRAAGFDVPTEALVRHEFIEAVIRLGMMKSQAKRKADKCKGGTEDNKAHVSLRRLMEDYVLPHYESMVSSTLREHGE